MEKIYLYQVNKEEWILEFYLIIFFLFCTMSKFSHQKDK